jgi:hypothetical protein
VQLAGVAAKYLKPLFRGCYSVVLPSRTFLSPERSCQLFTTYAVIRYKCHCNHAAPAHRILLSAGDSRSGGTTSGRHGASWSPSLVPRRSDRAKSRTVAEVDPAQPPAQPAIETPLQSLEAAYAKIRGELKAELLDLCPSEAVGGNSGPYGDSKVRRRVARAARNQRDFHHHVGLFEGCERLLLEDRE